MNAIRKCFLLVCFSLIAVTLTAQVRSVLTNKYGRIAIAVEVENSGCVIFDTYGNILDVIKMNGLPEFYSDFNDYEAGKIRKIDGVRFTYYSDFYDYEAGKIKSIGNIRFTYYSDFYNYEAGKIKSIGDVNFKYYSDFYDYESGKIKSIASVKFTYYSDFNDYESGKIKSIGNNKYTYYSNFDLNDRLMGKLKSGRRQFTANEIQFIVRDFR